MEQPLTEQKNTPKEVESIYYAWQLLLRTEYLMSRQNEIPCVDE
jgi:hypothetical protein